MLGYELYSSALADMLSEPSLSMPITVGLYAKWGSGKSFLLAKLRGCYFHTFYFKKFQFEIQLFVVHDRRNEGVRSPVDRATIAVFRGSAYSSVARSRTAGRDNGRLA